MKAVIENDGSSLYGPSILGIKNRIQQIITEQGFDVYEKEKLTRLPPGAIYAIRRFPDQELTRAQRHISLMTDIRYKGIGKK